MRRFFPLFRPRIRALRDLAVFAVARAGLLAAGILPARLVDALARRCGDAAFVLGLRRRRIALRNLDIAFREELSRAEKKRVARRAFEHGFASLAGLATGKRRARCGQLERLIRIEPGEETLLFGPRPHGLAVLSAHVGDWEMALHYLTLRGLPIGVVVRSVANPHLDREITRIRTERGGRVLEKRGALLRLRSTLARGEAVGLVPDQNCPSRERFFSFFGVLASTYTDHAHLLVKSRARVVFIACIRAGRGFRLLVRDLTPGQEESGAEATGEGRRLAADALVRRYLEAVEEVVRAHPEQYFWMHRRWKSRPTGAPWLYHDLAKPLDPKLLEIRL